MGTNTEKVAILAARGDTDVVAYFRAMKRDSFLTMVKFAFGIYLAFVLFDMILLPQLWLHFLFVRLLVFVPAMVTMILVKRRTLPLNFLVELVFFVPVTWANAYAVTKVPQEMYLQETSLALLLILPVAAITSWATREYIIYATLVLTGSVFLWQSSGSFSENELYGVYGMTMPVLLAGLLVVRARNRVETNRYRAETQLVQLELAKVQTMRRDIEARLLQTERHAFLAQHLGSFLADIDETIMLSELVVNHSPTEGQAHGNNMPAFEASRQKVLRRIEGFLKIVNGRSQQQPSIVGAELRAILPLIQHEVSKSNFLLTSSLDADLDSVAIDSGSAELSVIVFKLLRLAIESLRQARAKYPGSTFVGTVNLDVVLLSTAVQVTVEENGIGISPAHLAEFEELGFAETTYESGSQVEAKACSIVRNLRLGGGSVIRMSLPTVSAASQFADYRHLVAS